MNVYYVSVGFGVQQHKRASTGRQRLAPPRYRGRKEPRLPFNSFLCTNRAFVMENDISIWTMTKMNENGKNAGWETPICPHLLKKKSFGTIFSLCGILASPTFYLIIQLSHVHFSFLQNLKRNFLWSHAEWFFASCKLDSLAQWKIPPRLSGK